tara:strand:- start:34652 stop:35053 length:402 start_codon:yes stop_codon:yes gene_type:complete
MRFILDNHKSYDVVAMFKPVKLKRSEAWANFRSNLNAWSNGLKIPFETKITPKGFLSWLLVFTCHTVSLVLLPIFCCFGYSTYAYSFFTQSDSEKLLHYKQNLQRIYAELSSIEDKEEYLLRLKEEVARIKPF